VSNFEVGRPRSFPIFSVRSAAAAGLNASAGVPIGSASSLEPPGDERSLHSAIEHTKKSRTNAARTGSLPARARSLPKQGRVLGVEQGVDELVGVERNEVVDAFAETDEFHRNAEFGLDCEHDAAFG
jgi:hypothetical protein